ncbi:hypothetical protein VTK73DRAFT_6162 [Phialemonium thermophilum]|uniref:Zn(2)-C6 fungal-type domain-containing protein n=1 Tax=Phialemonium thermophilum TaxID=223376 RepID=A0ABR3WKR4_9PEZI
MKRRVHPTAEEPQPGRRQPQTSCDFCRRKKLKCDRGQPCFNCASRNLPCSGQPGAAIRASSASFCSPTQDPSGDLLHRVRALEQAVFGRERDEDGGDAQSREHHTRRLHGRPRQGSYSGKSGTGGAASPISEYGPSLRRSLEAVSRHGRLTSQMVPGSLVEIAFRVAQPSQPPGSQPQLARDPASATSEAVVWMMTRDQAVDLLEDYADLVYPLLPVIHMGTSRSLVADVYDRLGAREPVDCRAACLILAIGATSAYFWRPDTRQHSHFASADEATRASLVWQQTAFDVLNQSRSSTGSTLEELQAWTLLSFMVLNLDGCSYRFRFLHNCALGAARELSVHLVDSPALEHDGDDNVTRELKRRLWWHIAATDWMLGFMGGPVDGIYSVHPRHMNVRYPRNLNDNDIAVCDDATTTPLDVPTQMSSFLQRIRLGEIVRTILDARPPGSPEADVLDYAQVLRLDRLFEQAFTDLPPFLRRDADVDVDGASPAASSRMPGVELQRTVIQLGLLSRRTRLHRPFLLQGPDDVRYKKSRDICLQCARAILSISVGILESALNMDRREDRRGERLDGAAAPSAAAEPRRGAFSGSLLFHRIGSVINHVFMACTVLALYTGVSSQADDPGAGITAVERGADLVSIKTELGHACRVLGVLGRESHVAADLVRNLAGVLRRYKVQGVDNEDMLDQLDGPGVATTPRPPPSVEDVSGAANVPDPAYGSSLPDGGGGGGVGGGANELDLNLDGLWDDLMLGSSGDWSQLFADLDYYCGTA